MPQPETITLGLAFLIPLGFTWIAVGGLPPAERWARALVAFLVALGLAAAGYTLVGFALQYGGVGLIHNRPGYDGLIWEWSALGPTWGPGWGMAGLAGWRLEGPASTPEALTLALANLPWVLTAALIPVAGLRDRIPAWATALLGFGIGALVYPLAGNWIWGGGWLANLGSNLGLAHGFVDVAGGGLVHVLGAAVALATILVFLPRRPKIPAGAETLPSLRRGSSALLGVVALLAGSAAWIIANPLLPIETLNLPRFALNGLLAAAAGALLALVYTWLVAGVPDGLMAARGLATAFVAALSCAAFVPSWVALLIGALAGLLTPLTIFLVDHVLRWEDPAAALTVHGLGGALGLLAFGLFADGAGGAGWNGVGVQEYLGVAGQGVTGWLAAAGYRAGLAWPDPGAGGGDRRVGAVWLLHGLAVRWAAGAGHQPVAAAAGGWRRSRRDACARYCGRGCAHPAVVSR